MADPYAIVWDLDRTLGEFDALELNLGAPEVTVYLRPGIVEAVAELDRLGFKQTVLTLATARYAEIALRGTGLRDAFVEVAGVGQRAKGDARGVAELLGIAASERPHRMLFVGDHPMFDAPEDPEVVFHLEPNALHRHAKHVVHMVTELREHGRGSLRRGYDALLSKSNVTRDGDVRSMKHPTLGELLMVPRKELCPVICFGDDGDAPGGTPVRIEPDRHSPGR